MAVAATSVNRICSVCKESYPFLEKHVCKKGEAPVAAAPAAASEDPFIGSVLGERYQIESYLSSGGMGVVYKGRHVVLDKPVAIKLLRESQDPVAQQRFLLEAKSACHIGHEHIVDITDFGVLEDGRPYLVMEFLVGQTLETLLLQKGALPGSRVCRIGEQIARGLQAVHEKGILHRDLKPGNIFLLDRQRRDFVKILDFGIAKVMAGTRETLSEGQEVKQLVNMRQTTQGTVLGTPEYLSPEQAAGEPIDARVDIYALGCILYEMLTGEVPFRGNGPMSTLMKHLTETPVPPRKRRPDLGISDSLEAIVLRAMAREKEARFPTMEALAEALQAEVEQTPTFQGDVSASISIPLSNSGIRRASVAEMPLAYAQTTAAAVVKRPYSRQALMRAFLVGGGVLAVVAGLALAFLLKPRRPPAPPPALIAMPAPQQAAEKPAAEVPDAGAFGRTAAAETPPAKPSLSPKSSDEHAPPAKSRSRSKSKPRSKHTYF